MWGWYVSLKVMSAADKPYMVKPRVFSSNPKLSQSRGCDVCCRDVLCRSHRADLLSENT